MAISFVSSGTQADSPSGTTLSVPYPAGLAAGDLLVCHVALNGGAASLTDPAGWTVVAHENATSTNILGLFIKVAAGSETGSLSITTTSVAKSGQMHAFRGVDTSTPQDAAVTLAAAGGATATFVLPSITAVSAGTLPVYAVACGLATLAGPAGSTERADFNPASGAVGKAGGLWYDTTPQASAGATGTRTVTPTPSRAFNAAMMLLRPAAEVHTTTGAGRSTAAATAAATSARLAAGSGRSTGSASGVTTSTRSSAGSARSTAVAASSVATARTTAGTASATASAAAALSSARATAGTARTVATATGATAGERATQGAAPATAVATGTAGTVRVTSATARAVATATGATGADETHTTSGSAVAVGSGSATGATVRVATGNGRSVALAAASTLTERLTAGTAPARALATGTSPSVRITVGTGRAVASASGAGGQTGEARDIAVVATLGDRRWSATASARWDADLAPTARIATVVPKARTATVVRRWSARVEE